MRPIYLVCVFLAACGPGAPDPAADAKPADARSAAAADDTPGVTADAATRTGLGVALAPVVVADLGHQARGMATVIDSAAFATAIADLDSLRAEAAVASDNERRIAGLYADDGNASRQAVDAARQQSSSLDAKLAGAESRAQLEWGAKLARPRDATGMRLRTDVARGAITLFRAEFPDALESPNDLKYELQSSHRAGVTLEYLDRSRATAQFSVGDAVLLGLRTENAGGAPFRPGERVPVIASAKGGAPRPLVPAAAAVAYQGRLWCYVARAGDRFDRIPLDPEASSADGYGAGDSVAAGDQVVVQGAALLLSLERAASAEAGASAGE
jgi:hypothetical protein